MSGIDVPFFFVVILDVKIINYAEFLPVFLDEN